MNMTNKLIPNDWTYESRAIERIANIVRDEVETLLATDDELASTIPIFEDDEVVDAAHDQVEMDLYRLIAQCLLGPDKVKELD